MLKYRHNNIPNMKLFSLERLAKLNLMYDGDECCIPFILSA
jgi:hypothetical protein